MRRYVSPIRPFQRRRRIAWRLSLTCRVLANVERPHRLLIWACFLTLGLLSGLNAFIKHFLPRQHHAITRRAGWWRANVSEHPLVSEKHSRTVACGKGRLRWLTFHLPLRLEAALLVIMLALNIVPLCTFYSLYVGHNTYFVGTDSISRRSQILRHLANRCATLGIGQLPMLILLASKRTPVALLSQLLTNTMMLFHRWIARMCYLHVIVHILCNALIFHFSIGFTESLKQPPVQVGIAATVMLSGLVFLSLRTLRKKHYEVFVFLHISMAVSMLICVYLHIKLLHQGRVGTRMADPNCAFTSCRHIAELMVRCSSLLRLTACTADLCHRADRRLLGFRSGNSAHRSCRHVDLLAIR